MSILEQLETNGVALVRNLVESQDLKKNKIIDTIIIEEEINKHDIHVRLNKKSDTDELIQRIYGYDNLHPLLIDKIDNIIKPHIAKYFNREPNLGECWLQRNKSMGNTRTWHVDMPHPRFQVKVMIYCTDVESLHCGPFAFIEGTVKSNLTRQKLESMNDISRFNEYTQYSNNEVSEYAHRCRIFLGKIGDAIIFDVSGIHRGLKQRGVSREALTLSYYSADGNFRQHQ